MKIDNIIKLQYTEITDEFFTNGQIELKDDGDGIAYIAKWEYTKPIPEGLTLGKLGGN